jgi:alkylhydroperoxidase family enzyme
MPPRMTNPSVIVPGVLQPLLEITRLLTESGVPIRTLDLIRLRVSQLNGRVYLFGPDQVLEGADERLPQVAMWREASCFDQAERAALALAEAATHLGDLENPVPDKVWDQAAEHYDEKALGVLVIQIGLVNLWNRINIVTRQEPTPWR